MCNLAKQVKVAGITKKQYRSWRALQTVIIGSVSLPQLAKCLKLDQNPSERAFGV
jgi:hypothetical protein